MNYQSKKSYTIDEAKSVLENYCAYQERCHKEVRQKLIELKMIPEARDLIISHLINGNYLNESRFSKIFVRSKFNQKKWGKRRLINELKFRNISVYNIDLALKEISNVEYLKTFNEISENRFEQLRSESNSKKKMKKFIDYLNYRGWEINMIYEKKNELFN
jgi:regulatory protein